ncbi:MAG: [cytidine(C)-cytidine(C)-adenosine (A)]-adding enzyme, partial [Myxococcota bacterium]
TFRGEGPYLDGRRPSFVEFHREIERDLARRDFTMNAIAVDIESDEWVDPFGGVEDIQRRTVRCVGNARERFREDGLRPLRAVRFVSTLSFSVEADTRAALGAEPETFQAVAWERKRIEIEKLLVGPAARSALALLEESSLLAGLAPELQGGSDDLEALDRHEPDPWIRLIEWGLRRGVYGEALGTIATRWKSSVDVRQRLERGSAAFVAFERALPDAVQWRRWLSIHGLRAANDVCALLAARGEEPEVLRSVLNPTPPHRIQDLEIDGNDILELGVQGPEVGRVLQTLLEQVLEKPERNRRDWLLREAHRLSTGSAVPEDP